MKVEVSTTIKTDQQTLWRALQKVSSLCYAASPILCFKTLNGAPLPEIWLPGTNYDFALFLLGRIPLGKHSIKLLTMDQGSNTIQSFEHSKIVPSWRHTIRFHDNGSGGVSYTDEIIFTAGVLTFPVWIFTIFFYRYRQYRWRKFYSTSP